MESTELMESNRVSTRFTFTSESVTEGHPDKMCDQISDAVLDAILEQDPESRVACESMATTGVVIVAGEISTNAHVDYPRVVRDTVCGIGYDSASFGFDGKTCSVITSIDRQSPDIAQGVDKAAEQRAGTGDLYDEIGAGDQGMMFGYACTETADLMPLPIWLAHRLAARLTEVRKTGTLDYLRPDGKTQVTIEYEDGVPKRLGTVLISTQTAPGVDILDQLRPDLLEHVVRPLVPGEFAGDDFEFLCNPTGTFELGGPHADCGLTGRKIIVDTYGGMARHGGGAFSGKDPTKVDRSAAYAVRHVAKNVVAAGIASRCEVQVAYAIGVARPVSVMVETFGTSEIDPAKLPDLVQDVFDLRPAAIIERLQLRRPIFQKTAAYGHFGRSEPTFTWEYTDHAEQLRTAAEALA
jgi:S-adenosylmethionine synthetase